MNPDILQRVAAEFSSEDQAKALAELARLSLQDVMSESQTNLDNTLMAALQLSAGDVTELGKLIDAAKVDFRDVIYWAGLKSKEP